MILYKVEPSGVIDYKLSVEEVVLGGFFICRWIILHGRPCDDVCLRNLKDFDNWNVE